MCPTNIAVTFYAFMQRTNGSVSLTLRFPIFVVSNATLTNPENYWISVYFNQDVSDDKIKELVSNSYDIVVKSSTKKEREMLSLKV